LARRKRRATRRGEVGRADHGRLGAELGAHYAGFGAVARPVSWPLERVARGGEEQVVGGRDTTAADHEAGRVEGGGEVGDADAEPLADVLEQLDAHRVALTGQLGDHRACDLADVALDVLDDPVRHRESAAASSRASLTSALPELYCSQQPRLPHGQRWPPGTTCIWPNSPATPYLPRLTWPSSRRAADAGAERES